MATAKKPVAKKVTEVKEVKVEGIRTDFLEDKIVSVKYLAKDNNGIKDPILWRFIKWSSNCDSCTNNGQSKDEEYLN